MNLVELSRRFDPSAGTIEGGIVVRRYLADLRGCFEDAQAYAAELARGNPLVYTVSAFEPDAADGGLHCGIGVIQPGKVGGEFFLTKGHLHGWREAAEFYIGLGGEGLMVLEDEGGGNPRTVRLAENVAVYVPGKTSHRTVNTGSQPLSYLGVYPSKAGHDYGAIAAKNFGLVVMEEGGRAVVRERK